MRPDFAQLPPEEPYDIEEQEAELADRLHKEAQEQRAYDYYEDKS